MRVATRFTTTCYSIATGVSSIANTLLFVETYAPVLLRRKAVKLREETGDDRVSFSTATGNRSREPADRNGV